MFEMRRLDFSHFAVRSLIGCGRHRRCRPRRCRRRRCRCRRCRRVAVALAKQLSLKTWILIPPKVFPAIIRHQQVLKKLTHLIEKAKKLTRDKTTLSKAVWLAYEGRQVDLMAEDNCGLLYVAHFRQKPLQVPYKMENIRDDTQRLSKGPTFVVQLK